jgi:hypothetical protein
MVRITSVFVFIWSTVAFGQQTGFVAAPTQQPSSYRVPGTLAGSATFTPGVMLNRNQVNYYLMFFANYHLDRRVSLKSDSYLFLNSSSESAQEQSIFRSYFGAFYHFNATEYGNWDASIGFQPGVTYMEQSGAAGFNSSLVPSLAVSVAFDYYVWKYFHFFTQLSYVNSTMRDLPGGSLRTDELLFSAGLGFQIRTFK